MNIVVENVLEEDYVLMDELMKRIRELLIFLPA